MHQNTAKTLSEINTRFYARNAVSFSQTRNAPWDGWRRCMAACGLDAETALAQASSELQGTRETRELSVLDIACGNLRFEAFLVETYPGVDWRFFAIDNCESLFECKKSMLLGY